MEFYTRDSVASVDYHLGLLHTCRVASCEPRNGMANMVSIRQSQQLTQGENIFYLLTNQKKSPYSHIQEDCDSVM